MAKKSQKGDRTSELVQTATLTLLMTGGGFLVLFLVLVLFLIPSTRAEVDRAIEDYKTLAALLKSPEVQELRREAKIQELAAKEARSLADIIPEKLRAYGIERDRLVEAKSRDQRGWELSTKPTSLRQLLSFVTAVREAKKTVQVESLQLRRDRRTSSGDGEGLWIAEVVFLDYEKGAR